MTLAASAAEEALETVEDWVRRSNELAREKLFDQARDAAQQAAARDPNSASAQIALGNACLGLLKGNDAMAAYNRALELDPNAAEAHMRRALMFASAKRKEEALAAMNQALAIDAGKTQVHEIAASIYTVLGDKVNAEAQVKLALDINPKHIPSLMRYASILLDRIALDEAMACYQTVIAENPGHAEALFRKAMIHKQRVELMPAWDALALSIFANPGPRQPKLQYSEIIRSIRAAKFTKEHAFAILQCMEDAEISNNYLSLPWLEMARQDMSMSAFQQVYQAENYDAAILVLNRVRDDTVFQHPFLLKGIARLIVPNHKHELAMGYLRRYALEHLGGMPTGWGWIPLLNALARHHFLMEYIADETSAEAAAAERLGASLCAESSITDILTYGCYRLLSRHPHAVAISARLKHEDDAALTDFAIAVIDEPLEEKQIMQSVEMIGSFANETSKEVNAMYEENPYPRWTHVTNRKEPARFGDLVGPTFPVLAGEIIPTPEPLRILIPGCGTGKQSANIAMTFANSEVLAIDLSRASLAYAIRTSKKLGFTNITYKQADLLELPKHVDEKFDFIESTGVLHHLKDPKEGFKAVLSMLKPDGFLSVALYSEIARSMVVASRDFIAENNFKATPEGIRACRKALFALPKDHPTHIITQGRDFFTMSTCRDLIFHVQEHRFTLLQLRDLLEELNLEFLGFFGVQSLLVKAYKEMFPEDVTMTNREKWHAFEVKTPVAFVGMYHFWVRRKRAA